MRELDCWSLLSGAAARRAALSLVAVLAAVPACLSRAVFEPDESASSGTGRTSSTGADADEGLDDDGDGVPPAGTSVGAGSTSPEDASTTSEGGQDFGHDDEGDDGGDGGFTRPLPDFWLDEPCDPWDPICPPGHKCVPYDVDGYEDWDDTYCSPVVPDPRAVGEPCSIAGHPYSGIDDCDYGSMCWAPPELPGPGTCVALCAGSYAEPLCDDPLTGCAIASSGLINVCFPTCDPVLQDCDEGEGCYAVHSGFFCIPDVSLEGGSYGEPCDVIPGCDPGLFCLGAGSLPGCEGSAGCCAEACDATNPAGDAQCTDARLGVECQAWWGEERPPAGLEPCPSPEPERRRAPDLRSRH